MNDRIVTIEEIVDIASRLPDEELGRLKRDAELLQIFQRGKEDEEEILKSTALFLLDYYDQAGPAGFRRHFGILGISTESVLGICREILGLPSRDEDLADHG